MSCMYVMDIIPGTPASPGLVTCGTCGLSVEITNAFPRCCVDQLINGSLKYTVLFTTNVRHTVGVRVSNRARIHTVSVCGNVDAAGKYLYLRDATYITKVDEEYTAFSATHHFPMNLNGLSFSFSRYVPGHRGRRFIMSTSNAPVLDARADYTFRREGDYYVTELLWNAGPVTSIRVLRWAIELGNVVDTIKIIRSV